MYVLPAIDLVGGKCVRLIQGEYHRQINYGDDPVKQAKLFKEAGAEWLHIIDLEGAKLGKVVNAPAIKNIIESGVDLRIEVGGGIRDEDTIAEMLDLGVERLIIGTQAVNDFGWFTEMTQKFPGKLVLGIDARGSKVAIQGWTQESSHKFLDFAITAAELPLNAIIYTDISKDGMLCGPNIERTKALVEAVDVPIIAAGGVTEVEDIKKLKEINTAAAIIGRALYEGKTDLAEAINASK